MNLVDQDIDSSRISLYASTDEMLKITEQGFWVRGKLVPQDENEAQTVYLAFRAWLAWASLTRDY